MKMKLNHLNLASLFLLAVLFLSCKDESPDRTVNAGSLSMQYVLEDVTLPSAEVENFKLLSAAITTDGTTDYYAWNYSFEIHNKGSVPLKLSDLIIQGALYSGVNQHGAGSSTLADITILPGKFHTISYSANSSLLDNSLDIDGWYFNVVVYNVSAPLIGLNYRVHINE